MFYAELKEQATGMDAAELMDARLAVREKMERSVADKVKAAYGEKYALCGSACVGNSNSRSSKSRTRRKVETVGNDNVSAGVHFERCTPAVFSFYA